jgi:hypothetical protein
MNKIKLHFLALLVLSSPLLAVAGKGPDDTGARIVEVAASQLGKHDKDGGIIGLYHGHRQAWCSEFVSWVYFTAGAPMKGGRWDWGLCFTKWNMENAPRIKKYFRKHHRYFTIEEFPKQLTPKPGDYAFITNTDLTRSHSAIVKEVVVEDDGAETLVTIEGNNRGRAVAEYRYPNWRNNRVGEGVVGGIGLRN